MDKNIEIKVLEVAKYIIENKATINEVAEAFNMSTSTIKKYINNKDKLQSIDMNLYKKVKEVQKGIILKGEINGGKIGSREGTYLLSKEEVLNIIDEMLLKDLTYEEAEKVFNIPSSTLYESIKRYATTNQQIELSEMYDRHKTQNSKLKK